MKCVECLDRNNLSTFYACAADFTPKESKFYIALWKYPNSQCPTSIWFDINKAWLSGLKYPTPSWYHSYYYWKFDRSDKCRLKQKMSINGFSSVNRIAFSLIKTRWKPFPWLEPDQAEGPELLNFQGRDKHVGEANLGEEP